MARRENCPVFALKVGCLLRGVGTRKLVVKQHRVRVVDNSQPFLPESRAVVRFLVVSRFEPFVEAAELFPYFSGRQQKCARTVIDIAPEHVHRCERVVASSVAEARSIAPDDAVCLLKGSVEKDQASTYGADIPRASNRAERGLESARKYLGVIVQDEKMVSPGLASGLIYRHEEVPIFRIPDDTRALQLIQKPRRFILRGVIDDDDF